MRAEEGDVTQENRVRLYHSPNSRSIGTFLLLEELGAGYELRIIDIRAGDQFRPDYLAVNPMGKVPAIVHDGVVVTEQPAIFLYLADLFPQAGLAPAIGDALRGPYLRWMVFYGSCFEPAIVDRAQQRDPGQRATSPYGDFDAVLGALTDQLSRGPHLLGERFTAADILWGPALTWVTGFGLMPEVPAITDYVARFNARPGIARAREKEAEAVRAHLGRIQP
jgi:glutathione S-transferase